MISYLMCWINIRTVLLCLSIVVIVIVVSLSKKKEQNSQLHSSPTQSRPFSGEARVKHIESANQTAAPIDPDTSRSRKGEEGVIDKLINDLKDPKHIENWEEIASRICTESESDKAFSAVLDYIQRYDDWHAASTIHASDVIYGKVNTIMQLPHFGANRTADILQEWFTESGASRLASSWMQSGLPPGDSDTELIGVVRSFSAQALGRFGETSLLVPVADFNRRLRNRDFDNLGPSDIAAFYGSVDALAAADAIYELGYEEYLDRLPTDDNPFCGLRRYYRQYLPGESS